jgi:hypothetical protein
MAGMFQHLNQGHLGANRRRLPANRRRLGDYIWGHGKRESRHRMRLHIAPHIHGLKGPGAGLGPMPLPNAGAPEGLL